MNQMKKKNSYLDAKYYFIEELGKSNYYIILIVYNYFIYSILIFRWEIEVVELAVPMSPEEVLLKREAIYRHES